MKFGEHCGFITLRKLLAEKWSTQTRSVRLACVEERERELGDRPFANRRLCCCLKLRSGDDDIPGVDITPTWKHGGLALRGRAAGL